MKFPCSLPRARSPAKSVSNFPFGDSESGIPEDNVELVFGLFPRPMRRRRANTVEPGLGLAISRRIVELMGARSR